MFSYCYVFRQLRLRFVTKNVLPDLILALKTGNPNPNPALLFSKFCVWWFMRLTVQYKVQQSKTEKECAGGMHKIPQHVNGTSQGFLRKTN